MPFIVWVCPFALSPHFVTVVTVIDVVAHSSSATMMHFVLLTHPSTFRWCHHSHRCRCCHQQRQHEAIASVWCSHCVAAVLYHCVHTITVDSATTDTKSSNMRPSLRCHKPLTMFICHYSHQHQERLKHRRKERWFFGAMHPPDSPLDRLWPKGRVFECDRHCSCNSDWTNFSWYYGCHNKLNASIFSTCIRTRAFKAIYSIHWDNTKFVL